MTNEEAIKMLKSKMDGHTDTSYEWAETVRMAIAALEAEPCSDAISRQAALNMQYRIDDSVTLSTRDVVNVEDIEELPSVTPKAEPCDDAISRQATVERLCKVAEFMNEKRDGLGSPYVMAALFIQDNKDEFPSVNPNPKTGHWIKTISENGITSAVRCSECGFEDNRYMLFRYCPNCGTYMVESEVAE